MDGLVAGTLDHTWRRAGILGTAEETDQKGQYSPSEIAKETTNAISEVADEGKAAVQETNQAYVDNSVKTYNEVKEKTGSESVAALASYDPIGYYKDLGGKGLNYLGNLVGLGSDEEESAEKLPAGAVGATVDGSGAMIVHEDEELVPAKITSGAGKLASLLGAALDFMAGRSDIEKEISERMISQQTSSREVSAGFGPVTVHVSIQAPVTVQITKEMDLSKLDVSRLIDWSKVSYELEKVVKATFRTQEG